MNKDELARELERQCAEYTATTLPRPNRAMALAETVVNDLPVILSALQTESALGGGELCERLETYRAYNPNTDRSDHPICTEAAAHIRALEAENKRLDYKSIHSCNDRCDRLPCVQRREIAALKHENAVLAGHLTNALSIVAEAGLMNPLMDAARQALENDDATR